MCLSSSEMSCLVAPGPGCRVHYSRPDSRTQVQYAKNAVKIGIFQSGNLEPFLGGRELLVK